MLSSVSPTFVIVWLLANTLIFFLVTHFWYWIDNLYPIQLGVLILLGYFFVCMCSCVFIAKWFGVNEDKEFFFCGGCMVVLFIIHIKYYEHLQEKK